MERDYCIGFAQQIPGGHVFELGNGWLQRRIHVIANRASTTSIVNNLNGEEYLDDPSPEFELTVSGEGCNVVLDQSDFEFVDFSKPVWSDEARQIELRFRAELNDAELLVSVHYEARAGADFLAKWLIVHPCDLEGLFVTEAVIEKIKFREMVEGVSPKSRYPRFYPDHEDNVHIEPDTVDTSNPTSRFEFGDHSRALLAFWGYGEGLYFFTESLTGEESFHRSHGLIMKHLDYAPIGEGLETGRAVIGAYSGPPEIGFKRRNRHLVENWLAGAAKSIPVVWNTWLVTTGRGPVLADYDRGFLLKHIDLAARAGIHDVIQLDLGWEARYPLCPDPAKFPQGLAEIARVAREKAGADMAFWMNPFSCNYWKSDVETERREWLVPGKTSPRSGAAPVCVMSDYYDDVRRRLIDLVSNRNVRVIFWDGCDWNIAECSSPFHGHRDAKHLRVEGRRRLAELCRLCHEARSDLIIAAFNLPFDNHIMCALDKAQVSDTHSFSTIRSELIQRQQLYQMTFEHPFEAIWSSWHGIDWHEAGEDNIASRPLRELIHAEMSLIACGFAQAGCSIDLSRARPELIGFLEKLAAFRKRFARYFDTYQHVLGFPDGLSVDGSGHIVDGSGFIVLVNPSDEQASVRLPLDEPELELGGRGKHTLTDWSSLEHGAPMDPSTLSSSPTIDLAPLEVRYIGVNIES